MDVKILIKEAIDNLKNAYSPYSTFSVSSVLLMKSGKIYKGVNVENASYPVGLCAERNAMSTAISLGERDFDTMVIVGGKDGKIKDFCPPCGMCRQFIYEFADDDFKIILAKSADEYKTYNIKDLLPYSFDKKELG